ncbi:MAG TPA: vitamin K epoxide reductase family protein [Caulifigura sp.]|nr:vitamin K epoxide reductase family protein [Caulifigura sp.]
MSAPGNDTANRRIRTAAVTLSLLAAAVAGYLGIVSWRMHGTPWGCGAGSGCADVLRSRWSNVAGIPVGLFAALTYLALAGLTWRSAWKPGGCGTNGIVVVASLVMSTAIYFILLQAAVIQALCGWCLFDHALGLLAALTAFIVARRQTPRLTPAVEKKSRLDDPLSEYDAPNDKQASQPRGRRVSALPGLLAGVAISMGFVITQHFTGRMPEVARIESGPAAEGEGGDLKLVLKQGEAAIRLSLLPVLGSPQASRRLVLMYDYCCPHCREAHAVIRRLQPLSNNDWQVVFVPAPLNRDCNSAIEETEERFRDACELARLSLAVWKLRPDDWPDFDDWLFEPELPRPLAEAKSHAAALYGELAVAEALLDPVINQVIQSNVAAWIASGSQVLPVILSPGVSGIAGRTESDEELKSVLTREFGFPKPE